MQDFEAREDEKFIELAFAELGDARIYAAGEVPEDDEYAFSIDYDGASTIARLGGADNNWLAEHLRVFVLTQAEIDALFKEGLALCVKGPNANEIASPYDIEDPFLVSDEGTLAWSQCYVTAPFFSEYGYADFGPAADNVAEHVFFRVGD